MSSTSHLAEVPYGGETLSTFENYKGYKRASPAPDPTTYPGGDALNFNATKAGDDNEALNASATALAATVATKAPIASPTFTGTVTAPIFAGNLTGNVTGTISGSIAESQVTGLAAHLAPVTTTQAAATVFAGPVTGSAALAAFRALASTDIPNFDTAKLATGIVATARLGSGTATGSNFLRGDSSWATLPPGGTVTSVGLSLPSLFTVTGSPVTATGTLTASLANQAAHAVLAGPVTGSAAPTFRGLGASDIPTTLNATSFSGTTQHTYITTGADAYIGGSLFTQSLYFNDYFVLSDQDFGDIFYAGGDASGLMLATTLNMNGNTLDMQGGSLIGSGANLTSLNATNISSGTINAARLPSLSGTYLLISGGTLTGNLAMNRASPLISNPNDGSGINGITLRSNYTATNNNFNPSLVVSNYTGSATNVSYSIVSRDQYYTDVYYPGGTSAWTRIWAGPHNAQTGSGRLDYFYSNLYFQGTGDLVNGTAYFAGKFQMSRQGDATGISGQYNSGQISLEAAAYTTGVGNDYVNAYLQLKTNNGQSSKYYLSFTGRNLGGYSGDSFSIQCDQWRTNTKSGNIGINNSDPSAHLDIVEDKADRICMNVKAAASQTADLARWTNSSNSTLASISNAGHAYFASGVESAALYSYGDITIGGGATLHMSDSMAIYDDDYGQDVIYFGLDVGGVSLGSDLHLNSFNVYCEGGSFIKPRLENLASAPASPNPGQMYFNTATHKAQCYDGTAWQNLW